MADGEQPDIIGSARALLGYEIRRRRVEAGLSQLQLAKKIGYTRQYVSHAERPGHNLPSAEVVRAIDGALSARGELIMLREKAKSEQQRLRRGPVVEHLNLGLKALTTSAYESDPAVDANIRPVSVDLSLDVPPRGRVGRAEVDQVRLMTGFLASGENLYGGGMVGEAGAAHLRWSCRALESHCDPTARSSLFEAVGNLAGVVAFTAFDMGDHATATRCSRTALWCTEQAGSWELRAAVLTDMTRLSLHSGELDDALSLIEFAQVRRDRLTATARAVAAVVHARVLAVLGRHDQARAAVDRADAHFAERRPATDPPWLVYYDQAEHAGSSARALTPEALSRNRPGEAAERLATAIRLHTDAYPRSRAFSTARLAALYMAVGDPNEAVVLGRRAAADATGFHSLRMTGELRALMRAAAQHLTIPDVADLHHHLASTTADA
ncbi:helix-turn-helix transcriptional regulator [Actinosynnema sp. NPDC020468]|uniref:helix-turn-helix transcriptional regulator n=1 Tax=Actinosynnema sp. NPDC020468 TaxID=3154488 RepID=UPI0033EB0F3F